jgi:hypothetical protein
MFILAVREIQSNNHAHSGCGTWSLILREHRIIVSEKKVLRTILAPGGTK